MRGVDYTAGEKGRNIGGRAPGCSRGQRRWLDGWQQQSWVARFLLDVYTESRLYSHNPWTGTPCRIWASNKIPSFHDHVHGMFTELWNPWAWPTDIIANMQMYQGWLESQGTCDGRRTSLSKWQMDEMQELERVPDLKLIFCFKIFVLAFIHKDVSVC